MRDPKPIVIGQVTPSLEEFRRFAQEGNVIPVCAEFIADCETPVSAFTRFAQSDYCFLFESTEKNDVSGRFSFLGGEPRALLRAKGRRTIVIDPQKKRVFDSCGDPLDELRTHLERYRFVSRPNLPRFCGGAVGFLAYEMICQFEPKVGRPSDDRLNLPDMLFMVTSNILVFDHRLRTLSIIVNAFLEDGSPEQVYAAALERIGAIHRKLTRPTELSLIDCKRSDVLSPESKFGHKEFEDIVRRAQTYIRAGDVFQVVLSHCFEAGFSGDPLRLYRCLRFVNPSPYMFCLKFGDEFALVGSSPELHVRLTKHKVEIRPIAGTRPRGETLAEDEENATALLADPKERAEHVMLVDLARNDVGRIAEFGSVRVTEFMSIERYSHVMHMVSNVAGELRRGHDAFDVIRATFPAGTVSGAPKIRAMQIIAELEQTCRGCYAGAIGYVGFDGNLDSCIALRCAVLKDGKAYFQAGAGIVADSRPASEFEETVNKAGAMARALALART